MNFDNYKNFFPKRVYHCSCLHSIIVSCLQDGIYSLGDICHRIRQVNTGIKKIYCAKCGDDKQDVVFSCCDHMAMVIFSVIKQLLVFTVMTKLKITVSNVLKSIYKRCIIVINIQFLIYH